MYRCTHYLCAQLCTTDNILDVHLTVNITTKNVIHMRNNSDWRYIFTMEVNIMFTAIITANEGILYLTETTSV